jgi:hypothetical protein
MSLQQHRPTPDGGLEPAPEVHRDYRRRLRSRRWSAAELANPDVHLTNPWLAVGLIAFLAAGTFLLLVLGYWSGFWGG